MKVVEFQAPVTARVRVPETWGMRRIARELAGRPLVDRVEKGAFRPSQVVQISVEDIEPDDLTLISSEKASVA